MKRCPKCKGPIRCLVNLFLDIPGDLMHGLSKTALRSKRVVIDGAGWDRATLFCTRSTCGWMLRLGGERATQ